MSKLSPEATQQLADLAQQMAHNPKTRKQFTKLVREIDPSKRFADVEQDELRDSINERFESEKQAREAERVRIRLEAQRESLITSGRYTAEDVQKIEKDVMEKHGISDYEVAAKVYAADMKPASPTSEIKSRTWQLPAITKESLNNLNQHTLDNAYKVVDEFRGKRTA